MAHFICTSLPHAPIITAKTTKLFRSIDWSAVPFAYGKFISYYMWMLFDVGLPIKLEWAWAGWKLYFIIQFSSQEVTDTHICTLNWWEREWKCVRWDFVPHIHADIYFIIVLYVMLNLVGWLEARTDCEGSVENQSRSHEKSTQTNKHKHAMKCVQRA